MRTQRHARVRAFAAALTTAIVAGGMAVPAAAEGPRDSVVGAGTVGSKSSPTGEQHVAFAAFGGPTMLTPVFGSDPVTGHFLARGDFGDPSTAFRQEGPVTCLVVEGNTARLVYPNKEATPESNELFDVVISIVDNGRAQRGEPRDEIGFMLVPDETPTQDPPSEHDHECVAPPVPLATSPISQGDFTVRDVRP